MTRPCKLNGVNSAGQNKSVLGELRKLQVVFKLVWALIGKGKPPKKPDEYLGKNNDKPYIETTYQPKRPKLIF